MRMHRMKVLKRTSYNNSNNNNNDNNNNTAETFNVYRRSMAMILFFICGTYFLELAFVLS